MEGIFRFNISWFLNTPGLIHVGLINLSGFYSIYLYYITIVIVISFKVK